MSYYDAPEYDKNADPLDNIARGLFAVAYALHKLGLADACTGMGAIELLAKEVRDGFAGVSGLTPIVEAVEDIAGTLRDTLSVSVGGEVEISTLTAIDVELVRDET